MFGPEHYLRSPPATTRAPPTYRFITTLPIDYRFRPSALRLGRAALSLRGKMSNTLRALASAAPGAAAGALPPVAHREVAWSLGTVAEARLGSRLLPSAVPADVAEFHGSNGNAVGSLDVRRGARGSSIDFMLQSSLHCMVPNGAIDITSILIFLNATTDAPHFLLEFIQGSPTSMVVILDLFPRKDLTLNPEYINKYYEKTKLDKQRENFEELPQVRPYRSPSLFVRSVWSPTAIVVSIDCGQGGESILEDIVRGQLAAVAKEILEIWLHSCADHTVEMEEGERDGMIKRDKFVRLKSIEVDLTENLPRMFDPSVSGRVIAEIRKASGAQEV